LWPVCKWTDLPNLNPHSLGEGTGGEAAGDGSGVRVLGELQHGALADGTRRDDEDLCGHIDLLAEALAGGD